MSKLLHTLGSIGLVALTVFTPIVQHVIAQHPAVSAVLAGAWSILGHLLPSPLAPPAHP